MPSLSVACCLMILHHELDGAPWNWSAWKDRTKIQHGLFPADDAHLPPGWTRKNATDVKSYFHAYNELPAEKRAKFLATSKSTHPGRELWHTFVNRQWPRWKIHSDIITEMKEADVHPLAILLREKTIDKDDWPTADFYIPLILDRLGMKLFGEDPFPDGVEFLPTALKRFVQMFAHRTWNGIRLQVSGLRSRQNEVKAIAVAAFEGQEFHFQFYSFH